MFTIAAQRQLPYLVVASPKDEQELRSLVHTALAQDHPFALHYPRDPGFGLRAAEPEIIPVGRGEVLREGRDIVIVGFGPIVARGLEAAEALEREGWSVGVVNARFAKPLDRDLVVAQARRARLVVTLEESALAGGFGSGVLEALEEARIADPGLREVAVHRIGIPSGRFVDHGAVADLRRTLRLDATGIAEQVREVAEAVGVRPSRPVEIRETARAG
jgi:1-deoxy-D-xylulose-5-phosphate synthase